MIINKLKLFWKNRRSQAEQSQQKLPTVKELLLRRAHLNETDVDIFTKAMVKQIYEEWTRNIMGKLDMFVDNNGELKKVNNYEFSVSLNTETMSLKQAAENALDTILSDHPDIGFEIVRSSDGRDTRYTFNYENCLNDELPVVNTNGVYKYMR